MITEKKMNEKAKNSILLIAVVLLIASIIVYYFFDESLSGYIAAFAAPLCCVALYLSLKPIKNKIIILLALIMLCFVVVPSEVAYATIYQGYGHVGWIYPDGEAWAMVDTDAHKLSFIWSFSTYIITPWPGIYLTSPWSYIRIEDSAGVIYERYGIEEAIPNSGEINLDYCGINTWVTFFIQVTYQEVPPLFSVTPSIKIRFYVGHSGGDLNGDGTIDLADVNIVYQALGSNSETCDLNYDGKVNYQDLGLEFGYYLGWQTRYYTYAPPIETTATAFGQAINKIRQKYP